MLAWITEHRHLLYTAALVAAVIATLVWVGWLERRDERARHAHRVRWLRSQHPAVTARMAEDLRVQAALRDLGQTPEGKAYAEEVMAEIRKRERAS